MSPRRKKAKQSPLKNNLKRENNAEEVTCKRPKVIKSEEDELKARKKKNFVEACRQVSCTAYSDHSARLLLLYYFPSCMKKRLCKHNDNTGEDINEMPHYAEESFRIEMKNNMWYEALEVCQMCITQVQYLSANVLKEVVEIILNVHEDEFSEHTVPHIIDRCQQILSQNFSTHPPCTKTLKRCYISFLISPMDLKEKTYTNRVQYESKSGIVKYCMNRLENEISSESLDGPLINKCENIPEEMKQSLKGLHWQKEKFEIFELLNRPDRIERLMAVLESIVELLQFDLAIWQSRYTNNLVRHIMRSHKPLMAHVLWSEIMYTGCVNANCRQIMRLFVHLIHLQYPESVIRIITIWLNIMTQTFYLCEQNSNSDYPNTSKYCTRFASEFYKIISEMPCESIDKILERIEPAYMRHLIGILHIQKLTKTNNDCIISILINNIKELQSGIYPPDDTVIEISKKLFLKPKKIKRIIKYVLNKCMAPESEEKIQYAKLDKKELQFQLQSTTDHFSLSHLVHTQYTTLEAYLDTYDVQSVEETWNKLNEQISDGDDSQTHTHTSPEISSYYVTEEFIKKYRHIMKTTKELQTVFHDLKSSGDLPDILEIFTHIELFGHHLVHTQYTTLEAYLDTYDVQSVEETWNKLNEQISDGDDSQTHTHTSPEISSYYVTEEFIKKYRHIMKTTKELQTVFHDLKSSGDLPDILEIFTHIELFGHHLVHTQYTTLEAYLDTYDVQSVEETWNKLNEQISDGDDSQTHTHTSPEISSYYVTEEFIKKYRHKL